MSLDQVVAFVESEGGGRLRHAGGRTLLEHLLGTAAILERWGQPLWLQHAALIHSVYGTDVYRSRLVALSRRDEVAAVAGAPAERLAYLFCTVQRRPLLAGTYRWMSGVDASQEELDYLVLLHMANLADQARGAWLGKLRDMAELLIGSSVVTLPPALGVLELVSDEDEALALEACAAGEPALAAAVLPVVGEPCVVHAQECEGAAAQAWASMGRRRLLEFGAAWDKSRTFEEWLELAQALCEGPVRQPRAPAARFHRYVEGFALEGARLGRIYPDLPSEPWFDPQNFPLARYLESHFAAIRGEILALEPSSFHPESERIERVGGWDVAFFYERGRRRDSVCDVCPVTAGAIEGFGAMRTMMGLVYASRMRAGTHIAAHRGPTNLRVRCHLGISVPDGDCAIRVGEETRRWEEGRCLVFDDRFEHEAWNHTDDDRVVLIVDLWHPGLSAEEVRLLEGLHRYTYAHARRLTRYWAANAAAAAAVRGD